MTSCNAAILAYSGAFHSVIAYWLFEQAATAADLLFALVVRVQKGGQDSNYHTRTHGDDPPHSMTMSRLSCLAR